MTIRARLALSYGIAMILTILTIIGIVSFQVGDALRGSLDDALSARAIDVLIAVENDGQVGLQVDETQTPADLFIAIFDRQGAILDASIGTPPVVTLSGGSLSSGDLQADGVRYAVEVVRDSELGVTVVVGSSLAVVDAALGDVTRALLLAGGAGVVASLAVGWWLAGRALRPVADMTAEAAVIGSSDLDARLPLPPVHDELGVLAETLNGMIDRLAEGLRRERRFIAGASHQLRTPLAALQTGLELAEDERLSTEEVRAAVGAAHADVIRLAELTTALLALAAADAEGRTLVRSPVLADELVRSAVRQVESRAKLRGSKIRCHAPSSEVRVDRIRLEQAIVNLVVNAVAYGPAGGQVDVVANVESSPDGSVEAGEILTVEVLDQGPGVPDDLAMRIFQPFQRGPHADVEGAGLGLATAASAIRAHHGTVGVAQRDGGGARFWFQVPA